MKVYWALICQTSIIDRDTNNISLINVVEEVMVLANPPVPLLTEGQVPEETLPTLFEVVALWARSDMKVPESGEGRMRLVDPDNNTVLTSSPYPVDLTTFLRTRIRTRLPGLPYRGTPLPEGIYRFVIEERQTDEWVPKYEVYLRVVVQSQQSG